MDIFQFMLLMAALVVAVIARNLPRANLWIWLAVGNFAVGSIYQHLGYPNHAAIVLGCDVLMCLAIGSMAKEIWEIRIFNVFQLSVLISILKLFDVGSAFYVISLEVCNWLFLLIVGGTAILSRIRANGNHIWPDWRRVLSMPVDYLRAPCSKDHFIRRHLYR